MKIELKRISFSERNSEETNCFAADLYIDGKKVGYANNSGQGGCTDYHGNTPEDNKIIAEAEKYCKTLPKWGDNFDNSLEDVINNLLSDYLLEKEAKKKEKMYLKAFCYGVPNGRTYSVYSWKGKTLKDIPLPILQKSYNNIKAGLAENEVFFNTNLKELGLNI
jgi:hypothetical protein